jgi:putative transposase
LVIKAGGKVPATQLIRCKVRHFSDGVALGSKSFVENVFQGMKGLFSPNRKDGARPLRSMPMDGRLFTLRAEA